MGYTSIKAFIRKHLGEAALQKARRIKYFPMNLFCGFFPTTDAIVLESNPDLACNTFAVYRVMLSHGMNETYKLIWRVHNPESYGDYHVKNVEFIDKSPKGRKARIKNYRICNRAIASISCNQPLPNYMVNRKQLNIYLDHGSPLKDITHRGHKIDISCDYLLSQAPFFDEPNLYQYNVKAEQLLHLGIPRNDQLFQNYDSLQNVIPELCRFQIIIIWVPTFRVAESGKRCDSRFDFPLGIPVIYSVDQLRHVNSFLQDRNTLLLIKPHPAQDINRLRLIQLSNIYLLSNDRMLSSQIQTNELLAQTDAMITDYSGIYYDYLLLDKPIGITLDDFDEYKKTTGFVFENPLDVLVGEYIHSVEDLETFIDHVYQNVDLTMEERKKIKERTNQFCDAKSSERVYDFIVSRIGKGRKGPFAGRRPRK